MRRESRIVVDDDVPEEALPGRLTHEGTHAVQANEKTPYTLASEREAFDNAYLVDLELGSPIQDDPSDKELERRYRGLSWPAQNEQESSQLMEAKSE